MNRPALLLLLLLSGCSHITFVKSGLVPGPLTPTQDLQVFYSKTEVPFEYKEIGRIFLKQSKWSSHNPARSIEELRREAAKRGAQAVIVLENRRFEATGSAYGGIASSNAKEIVDYVGIAIVRKPAP